MTLTSLCGCLLNQLYKLRPRHRAVCWEQSASKCVLSLCHDWCHSRSYRQQSEYSDPSNGISGRQLHPHRNLTKKALPSKLFSQQPVQTSLGKPLSIRWLVWHHTGWDSRSWNPNSQVKATLVKYRIVYPAHAPYSVISEHCPRLKTRGP